jgi:hypothetical protein
MQDRWSPPMNRHEAARATWAPGQRWETRNDEQAHDPNAWVPVGNRGRAQPLWDEHQEYRRRPDLEQDPRAGCVHVQIRPGAGGDFTVAANETAKVDKAPASTYRPAHGGYPGEVPRG